MHIPGYGWWYAVTVIDYYSRYLLACHLTHSYSATETALALKRAPEEAARLHGPLSRRPLLVTDNGSSFIARKFAAFVAEQYRHVRIQYRMPQQLSLLERVHATRKNEEVHWRLSNSESSRKLNGCLRGLTLYVKRKLTPIRQWRHSFRQFRIERLKGAVEWPCAMLDNVRKSWANAPV